MSGSSANDTTDLNYWSSLLNVARIGCMQIYPPLICSLGIVTNCLNIVVLTRKWMGSSTNVYLTAVACADMCYLTLFFIFSLLLYPSLRESQSYMHIHLYVRATANVCSNTTTWLTVTFTVERYIAVCHPMLRHAICTKERARWIVFCVVIFCILLTSPDYFLYNVIPPSPRLANSTAAQGAKYYSHDKSKIGVLLSKVGYSYVNQVAFIIIPLTLLIVFNTLLVRSVIRATKFRRAMLQASSGPSSATTSNLTSFSTANKSIVSSNLNAPPSSINSQNGGRRSLIPSQKSSANSTAPPANSGTRRNRGQSEQQRITMMLIVVVITFVLLQLPSTVAMVIDSLATSERIQLSLVGQYKFKVFGNFVNACLLTSAALNFVLYSMFSAKFRETFVILFPCCYFFSGGNAGGPRTGVGRRTGAGWTSHGVGGVGHRGGKPGGKFQEATSYTMSYSASVVGQQEDRKKADNQNNVHCNNNSTCNSHKANQKCDEDDESSPLTRNSNADMSVQGKDNSNKQNKKWSPYSGSSSGGIQMLQNKKKCKVKMELPPTKEDITVDDSSWFSTSFDAENCSYVDVDGKYVPKYHKPYLNADGIDDGRV